MQLRTRGGLRYFFTKPEIPNEADLENSTSHDYISETKMEVSGTLLYGTNFTHLRHKAAGSIPPGDIKGSCLNYSFMMPEMFEFLGILGTSISNKRHFEGNYHNDIGRFGACVIKSVTVVH